ncbi:thiolase domain-containing protein [soil metagenome]
MSIKAKASIVGAFEHPTRQATGRSTAMLHAECANGACDDAGISLADVDGYFGAGDGFSLGALSMVEYLDLKVRHLDSTDIGGSSYVMHVDRAARAVASGACNIALITLAGRPRSQGVSVGTSVRTGSADQPDVAWEAPFGATIVGFYAMCAARHMHDYGTTSEQLACIKVAASLHAQHNPNAMRREVVTIADVLASPMVADPLHRLDCCVVSDGGGALIVTRPEIARTMRQPLVSVLGCATAIGVREGASIDLTSSAARVSSAAAFGEAGVTPADIQYASIYDSFTITVLMQLEDLGFCAKGEGGRFVEDGNLVSGIGRLPFNTDGGGLCNNHPNNRGGMTKVIEAVRQLRGQAHPAVQVRNCELALAQGMGGMLGARHGSSTLILGRE